jgi:hypothetical protein
MVDDYVTKRGRRRQRTVTVELDAIRELFRQPVEAEHAAWQQTRRELSRVVGESTFEIWLEPMKLIAVDRAPTHLVAGGLGRYGVR